MYGLGIIGLLYTIQTYIKFVEGGLVFLIEVVQQPWGSKTEPKTKYLRTLHIKSFHYLLSLPEEKRCTNRLQIISSVLNAASLECVPVNLPYREWKWS